MSMYAARARWSGPPQGVPVIDRGDPFARGLIYAGGAGIAPPGSTDGSAYFTRTNGLLANVAQAAGTLHGYFTGDVPDIKTSAFGPVLICDGTRKVFTQSITGPANGAAPDETCLVICSLGSSSGSQHIFGYGNVWSTSLADYGRGIGIEGGQLLAWGASATNNKKVGVTLPALNVPVVLAARFSGPSSPVGTGAVFVNGAKAGSGDMSHAWSYYLATGAGVAATESVEVANFTGLIGLRLWWRRALSDAEIIEISRNPWRVFRKPDDVVFYTAGSGGTFTTTWSLDAAIQQSRAATASLDAALQAQYSTSVGLDAALQLARTATSSLDAAVQLGRSDTASLDAAIEQARSAIASLDAYVLAGSTATFGADAAVQVARSVSASLDAAVQLARSGAVSFDALITELDGVQVLIDAAIQYARTSTVALDAYVQSVIASGAGRFAVGPRTGLAAGQGGALAAGRGGRFNVH